MLLQDFLAARGVLWLLIKREFRGRYAGSNFGVLWNLVHPIVLIMIYITVFSRLMGSSSNRGGSAYMVHMTSGMVPWLLFSEILNRSCNVLLENSSMLKKMAIPEEVLFLSVFVTSFTIYGISVTALMILLLALGAPLTPGVLFVFPVMVLLGLSALGIGMILSVLNLFVRDVAQFVTIALNICMWSLPIVYFPSILPPTILYYSKLNPIYGFFSLIQRLFGSPEAHFNPDSLWTILLLPFFAMLAGMSFLRSKRSEILDTL
ncbi:ABC transporter permease [soil metagenome]